MLMKAKTALTVNNLKREAAKHGDTVENDSSDRWSVYQCCTPVGKCWACDGSIHINTSREEPSQ